MIANFFLAEADSPSALQQVFSFFTRGGLLMWPLLICSVVAVTTIMFACSYGVAFGALQQIPEIVPGLADVKEKTTGQPPPKQREIEQKTAADYTKVQEIGGLVGRFLLAFLAVRIVSRRALIRAFLVPALVIVPAVFFYFLSVENHHYANTPVFQAFS